MYSCMAMSIVFVCSACFFISQISAEEEVVVIVRHRASSPLNIHVINDSNYPGNTQSSQSSFIRKGSHYEKMKSGSPSQLGCIHKINFPSEKLNQLSICLNHNNQILHGSKFPCISVNDLYKHGAFQSYILDVYEWYASLEIYDKDRRKIKVVRSVASWFPQGSALVFVERRSLSLADFQAELWIGNHHNTSLSMRHDSEQRQAILLEKIPNIIISQVHLRLQFLNHPKRYAMNGLEEYLADGGGKIFVFGVYANQATLHVEDKNGNRILSTRMVKMWLDDIQGDRVCNVMLTRKDIDIVKDLVVKLDNGKEEQVIIFDIEHYPIFHSHTFFVTISNERDTYNLVLSWLDAKRNNHPMGTVLQLKNYINEKDASINTYVFDVYQWYALLYIYDVEGFKTNAQLIARSWVPQGTSLLFIKKRSKKLASVKGNVKIGEESQNLGLDESNQWKQFLLKAHQNRKIPSVILRLDLLRGSFKIDLFKWLGNKADLIKKTLIVTIYNDMAKLTVENPFGILVHTRVKKFQTWKRLPRETISYISIEKMEDVEELSLRVLENQEIREEFIFEEDSVFNWYSLSRPTKVLEYVQLSLNWHDARDNCMREKTLYFKGIKQSYSRYKFNVYSDHVNAHIFQD